MCGTSVILQLLVSSFWLCAAGDTSYTLTKRFTLRIAPEVTTATLGPVLHIFVQSHLFSYFYILYIIHTLCILLSNFHDLAEHIMTYHQFGFTECSPGHMSLAEL